MKRDIRRESKTDSDRQIDKKTDKQIKTDRRRVSETETDRQMDRKTLRETDRQLES